MTFLRAARQRALPHALFFLVIWPLLSIGLGGALLMEQQVVAESAMPLRYVYFGLAFGALRMLPEFIIVGLLLTVVAVALASLTSRFTPVVLKPLGSVYGLEAALLFLAGMAGIAFEFPSILSYPLLRPLRPLPVAVAESLLLAVVLLLALVLGFSQARWSGAIATAVATVLMAFLGFLLTRAPLWGERATATPGTTVVFGIDSLSQADDVAALRDLTRRYDGTWYERPVTPGFTTNLVWASILMHRNAPGTGVFFIRQSPDWTRAPFNLVASAKSRGYLTVSFFSDQFTAFQGSEGGFDIDRSGPKGWLQVATASTKDASVLLPLVLPRLPRLPFAGTPPNQSGTYAFDVRREINSILTAGRLAPRGKQTLVAAHLDYLHQMRFPSYSEVSAGERRIIRSSPVRATMDQSFNFQYEEPADDALRLYAWKIRHLQTLMREELERSRFLEPRLGNRLILFSDHGNRNGLALKTYDDPRYHRVIFATFGMPARDPEAPISLAAISELLGFADPSRPRVEPSMTLAPVEWRDWEALGKSARISLNGEYSFDPLLLEAIGKRMTSCAPWDPVPPYAARDCDSGAR